MTQYETEHSGHTVVAVCIEEHHYDAEWSSDEGVWLYDPNPGTDRWIGDVERTVAYCKTCEQRLDFDTVEMT